MNDDIRQKLRSFILTNFLPGEDPSTLDDSTLLISGGVLASLSLIELASFIEEEFSLSLLPGDLGTDKMDSIDLLVQLVAKRSGEGSSAGSGE